jgi:hypothetical protein
VTAETKPFEAVRWPLVFRIRIELLLATTLALCIIRLWLMPLPSSFWVDEMGTAFVVHNGASAPSLRAAPQVADSIYYWLPKLAEMFAGMNEISYRLFSVFAMGGSLLAIAGIAARLFDTRAAWLAVFGCLAFKNIDYQASDARPYALGTLVLSVAILLLIRWMDSGRVRDEILFAAVASLLWWVHLVFWPFYILFFLYAGFRVEKGQTRAGRRQLLAIFSGIAVATAPVALRSLSLLHQASAHIVAPPPEFRDLILAVNLSLITGACTLAFLISRFSGWRSPLTPASSASILLITGWWLLDPLTLFGFSRLTGSSIFVSRYMYLALPGAALTVLLLVALSVPPEQWKNLALGLGAGVLLFGGHWDHVWPPHHNSDWRGAARALKAAAGAADMPVICPSPFIEARSPEWRPDYPVSGFLYANLAVYPPGGHLYPFPFESSPEVEKYARTLSIETLSHAPRFAVYGGDRSVGFWRDWLSRRPELEEWDNRVLGRFGDVEVVVFARRDWLHSKLNGNLTPARNHSSGFPQLRYPSNGASASKP